jgi:hypothetical protein
MPPFSVAFERKESGLADRLVDRNQRHLRKRQKTGNDRPCFIDAATVSNMAIADVYRADEAR